jgi:A/G-specific adenine glycosylase
MSPDPVPAPMPEPLPPEERNELRRALLAWYDARSAAYPWRGCGDPYRIWISEVMLQQTRVATVVGYYHRFLDRFPTLEALAAASLAEVLQSWEGLGYYSRARHLHRLAEELVERHGGVFPQTAEALRVLPGIGPYTAAAIASIAFGQPAAVVDGNVARILSRLFDLPEEVDRPAALDRIRARAQSLLAVDRPGDFNQALMDFGRTICTPRQPGCSECPIAAFCLARQRGTVHLRPVRRPRRSRPLLRAAAAVLRDPAGRLLLGQRPLKGLWGGLWALPGGLCDPDETNAAALVRSLAFLGGSLLVEREMASATQDLTHFRVHLRAFACRLPEPLVMPLQPDPAWQSLAWVSPDQLAGYSMGKADRQIVEQLTLWQPRLFEEP